MLTSSDQGVDMQKLLNAYRAARLLSNAQKLRAYDRSHPMSACMLAKDEADLLADAIQQANLGLTNA
jgi:hypothetical protein